MRGTTATEKPRTTEPVVRATRLVCRPIAAQFMSEGVIALLAFEQSKGELPKIELEKHYKLVPSEELSQEELQSYGLR